MKKLMQNLLRSKTFLFFWGGLLVVNFFAIFQYDFYHILMIFSLIYLLVAPGLLFLTLLTEKKIPLALGLAFSVLLSIFVLMILGFIINEISPFFGIGKPLDTYSLLGFFDIFISVALFLVYKNEQEVPLENASFFATDKFMLGVAVLLPLAATFGAIVLNNGGSNWLAMFALGLIATMVFFVVCKQKINSFSLSLALYSIAVALLLMTSMRSLFLTGHDVHLEYHVFKMSDNVKFWNIATFRDAYNACLSITIFPVFLQSLSHLNDFYIFKIIFQFINALIVIPIFYLSRQFTSKKISFLTGFLYVSFPTFIVDMSMLNRQGIALLFFSGFILILLAVIYFKGKSRMILLFIFGTGMILSHYSTSYVALALLIGGYFFDRLFRFFFLLERPMIFKKTSIFEKYREMCRSAKLITLPLIVGLVVISAVWTGSITKTSKNFTNAVKNIFTNIRHPFSQDENSGSAKYSLVGAKELTKEELFDNYKEKDIKNTHTAKNESNLFSMEVTQKYKTMPIDEPVVPLTPLGQKLQSVFSFSLKDFFNQAKQSYAKAMQIFIVIGLCGFVLGSKFKNYLKKDIPMEYLSLFVAGLGIMIIQTMFNNIIDYGVLRLFQQNMVFLAFPICLSFIFVASLFLAKNKNRLLFFGVALVFSFLILSGFITQLTGNGRPLVALNNSGFYYDAYFAHTQETKTFQWLKNNADLQYPVQSDRYFSSIKMQAYSNIYPDGGLLPETIKKNSYVFFGFSNVKNDNVIEFIGGDVVYYHFPIEFLTDNKNLIYNNQGSQIYR